MTLSVNLCPICNSPTAKICYYKSFTNKFFQSKESNFCFNHELLISTSINIFNNMYKIYAYEEFNDYLYCYIFYIKYKDISYLNQITKYYKSSINILASNKGLGKIFSPIKIEEYDTITNCYVVWKSKYQFSDNKPFEISRISERIKTIINFL